MNDVTALEIVPEMETVRWEPCAEFHDDPDAADGRCAGCGWAPDDHDVELPAAA